tara:strand:+ start:56070 stop:57860 length:1791 start_codon:yes stop_codon:yes gene_type:complete
MRLKFNYLKMNFIKQILLSTLIINIIFYKIPADIYYYNRADFHNFAIILIPTILIFGFSILFHEKIYRNKKIFNFFLFLSVYIIISKIFMPLDIDELEGSLEKPTEYKYSLILEILIFIASYFIVKFFKTNEKFLSFIALFAFIIFTTSSYYYVRSFGSLIKNQYNYFGIFKDKQKNFLKKTEKPNIYLLTFDALSSFGFQEIIDKNDGYKKIFNGFKFFPNNSSNYSHTSLSVNSFLVGNLFNFDTRLSEWKDEYRKGGIISEMIKKNYEVWQYVQSSSMQHQDVSLGTTNVDILLEKSKLSMFIELYDFVILRVSPQFLHQEIYNNGSGLISKLYKKIKNDKSDAIPGEHFRVLGSKMLFERLIEEEALRTKNGIFLHAHIYIPHGPYVLDSNAEYDPTPYNSNIKANLKYLDQTKGTIYLIDKFINRLKEQGKFKNSLIIINGDHGSWEIGLKSLPNKYSHRKKDLDNNLRHLPAHNVFNQSKAILIIKGPFQGLEKNMETNFSKTQLLDIYPTIKSFSTGGTISDPNNNQMLSLLEKLPRDRTLKYFVGYKKRKSQKHQWTTIEKEKGGYIDLFEISNENFLVKKERIFAEW